MIRPIGQRVLVQRLDAPKATSSLIEVIEHNPKASSFALVVALGQNLTEAYLPGDVVILKDYAGAPLQLSPTEGGLTEEYLMVREEDILAVMEGM